MAARQQLRSAISAVGLLHVSSAAARQGRGLARCLSSSSTPPMAAAASAGDAGNGAGAEDAQRWDQMLDRLSSMISGKRKADGSSWQDAHENMPVYLQRLGIAEAVQQLSVIHVAGTKGKGSTCAMVDSILRASGYTTGLFTSPHLCDVRERIRLNGRMVSKPLFVDAFWHCYNTLQAAATPEVGMPGYFRFLTLLGLHIFVQSRPQVVILEVGIGGRIDATNVIRHTAVTGITSLGFDHMELLGDTLDLIAREKAGIMRQGVPCFTVTQPPEAAAALEACAADVGAQLHVALPLAQFSHPQGPGHTVSVGLAGEHQVLNASLAVALVRSWEQRAVLQPPSTTSSSSSHPTAETTAASERLQQLQSGVLPLQYCEGLQKAAWPGRSQIVPHPDFSGSSRLLMYLDGAHTPESMVSCAQWFASVTTQQQQQQQQQASTNNTSNAAATAAAAGQQQPVRVLIFNCMKERDPSVLLSQLHSELRRQGTPVHVALFVPPDSQYAFLPSSSKSALVAAAHQDLSWQQQLAGVWRQCDTGAAAAAGQQPDGDEAAALRALLPPLPVVEGVGPQQLPADGSAVLRCMADALGWLAAAATARPQLQLQVLVTGSLYLVGDCLAGLDSKPT